MSVWDDITNFLGGSTNSLNSVIASHPSSAAAAAPATNPFTPLDTQLMQRAQANPSTPTFSRFAKWGGAYAVFAVVMLSVADTEYGEVAAAMTWLVTVSAIVYWWAPFDQNLAKLIGSGTG